MTTDRRRAARLALVAVSLLMTACRQDMQDQPKYQPLERSRFFADGRASRPLVEGTVASGQLAAEGTYATGKAGGGFVAQAPLTPTEALLRHGGERYDIYCAPCHDRVGNGGGMIVQRGYRRPPSFHIDRLRGVPDGYLFDVVTNGFGVMPSYAVQVPVADRWAVVLYVRALQLSQHATLDDVPAAERDRLSRAPEGR